MPDPLAGQLGTDETGEDILSMDIDQLSRVDVVVPSMDVEVTSVTRSESTVGKSAAAVFVITSEMIRRSGATCVPEALRMVPGMDVARINSDVWAISCRGFNDRNANKLLVQIDGRQIYTPMFGGVYWENNTVMIQDVERIEVIRGPGATVWGSNAVNGVINIISKSAEDTQGLLIGGRVGDQERGFTDVRYGGQRGKDLYWRVYGQQFDRNRGAPVRHPAMDDWRMAQGGFRTDYHPDPCNHITVQGDYYNGYAGASFPTQFPTPPYAGIVDTDVHLSGGNVLGRWTRDLGEDSGWAAQLYYNQYSRHSSVYSENVDVVDFDFQRQFPLGYHQKWIWGAGYRHYADHTQGTFSLSMNPAARRYDLFSCFVQDEITLREDRLHLTAGSKFEINSFTNFEFQPTIRLLWSPDPRHAAWGAVSRAVRIPTRGDENLRYKVANIPIFPPPAPPMFVQITGDPSVQAEDLLAWEMGYRVQATDRFAWDVAVFLNQYTDLIVFNPGPMGYPIWPWSAVNGMDGETYGFELNTTYQVSDRWRITGNYSFLQMQMHADAGVDPRVEDIEGQSPRNQAYMRSSWDLGHNLEMDAILRYVDHLPSDNIPAYITMDARLGWRPSECCRMEVVGQNLLDQRHVEFGGMDTIETAVRRGVYYWVTWEY